MTAKDSLPNPFFSPLFHSFVGVKHDETPFSGQLSRKSWLVFNMSVSARLSRLVSRLLQRFGDELLDLEAHL